MYTIPAGFNLTQFHGAIVEQICFALNNICLMLNNCRYISFEGDFHFYEETQNHPGIMSVYPVNKDFGLLKLLEQKIEILEVEQVSSNLLVVFENKMKLKLIASINYESYSLKSEDQLIRI